MLLRKEEKITETVRLPYVHFPIQDVAYDREEKRLRISFFPFEEKYIYSFHGKVGGLQLWLEISLWWKVKVRGTLRGDVDDSSVQIPQEIFVSKFKLPPEVLMGLERELGKKLNEKGMEVELVIFSEDDSFFIPPEDTKVPVSKSEGDKRAFTLTLTGETYVKVGTTTEYKDEGGTEFYPKGWKPETVIETLKELVNSEEFRREWLEEFKKALPEEISSRCDFVVETMDIGFKSAHWRLGRNVTYLVGSGFIHTPLIHIVFPLVPEETFEILRDVSSAGEIEEFLERVIVLLSLYQSQVSVTGGMEVDVEGAIQHLSRWLQEIRERS